MKRRIMYGAALAALMSAAAGTASAQSQAVASAGADAAAAGVEELVVFGRGETRQVQVVDGAELSAIVPGASPLKLVDKLPNVNLQSADPFGAYEWSSRISIRGFDRNRLGFTLDDVPLGDMTYGNHNGLHISRAIAGENVGQVELSQGSGALSAASASDLGGSLQFMSRDPSQDFGGLAAATAGSDNTYRGFLRVESGDLASGARGYLSYSYNTADKWKGDGKQRQQQINAKVVQPIGEGALTAWLNWSTRQEQDYQDMSLEMISRLGRNWDNFASDYATAVAVSEIAHNRGDTGVAGKFPSFGTVYPGKIASADDSYYDASGLRDDIIGAITFATPVGEHLNFKATAYGHTNDGQGLWVTPYVTSPNYGVAGATKDNAPLSIRTTEYDLERYGLIASAVVKVGSHAIEGGFWYEDNAFTQARRFYAVDRTSFSRDMLKMQRNPFRTDWLYNFDTTSWKVHISDTWTVTDALTVNFGFKSLSVENEGETLLGADKTGVIKAEENFLPQAGVSYDLTENSQLFAGYAENMRAFASSGTSGPFSTSKAGFDAIKGKLKPELSKTFEAGWRFKAADVQGVVAVYHVQFKNRLFGVPVGSGIQGNPSALSNVGGVTAKGFEAAGVWTFAPDWSLFASYAYNDSTYDDDTRDGNGAVVGRTAGKTTVDTPKNLLKAELSYDNGSLFGRAGLSYLSRRYFSYENDQSVPSQTVADLTVGYRLPGEGWTKGLEVQLNVTNLFDKDYVSTIDSNGFPLRGDSQTLLTAPPRQVFVSLRKSF